MAAQLALSPFASKCHLIYKYDFSPASLWRSIIDLVVVDLKHEIVVYDESTYILYKDYLAIWCLLE